MTVITGFHAIEESLRTGAGTASGGKATLKYSKAGPRVKKILEDAKRRGIHAEQVSEGELNKLVSSLSETAREHRGLVLVIEGISQKENIVQFDDFVKGIKNSGKENSIVVILDSVTDPHNIGAIIRSCDQFGADLVIMPEHNSNTTSDVIARASAGANAWVPLSVVTNLNHTVEKLKDAGYWIYGADANGTSVSDLKLTGRTVIIMGSEGSGISRLLKEKCDGIASIPTCGKIDSLNVSVAAGILLYETKRQQSLN